MINCNILGKTSEVQVEVFVGVGIDKLSVGIWTDQVKVIRKDKPSV